MTVEHETISALAQWWDRDDEEDDGPDRSGEHGAGGEDGL